MSGSLTKKTTSVDATIDPNLTVDDSIVFFSATSAGGTIYLPAAKDGKEIILIRTNGTSSASVSGLFGSTINGIAVKALSTTLYTETRFISDGTDWYANDGTPI